MQQHIQKAKYCAFILYKTLDVSDEGQISICFRITMDDLDVQELFCSFYETTSTTSEELFKIVKDVLSKFQLPIDKCRGQCYDDAANVSVRVKGLRMKFDS